MDNDKLDKVIKGLNTCFRSKYCEGCPYETLCKKAIEENDGYCPILDDALELMKEQQKIVRCENCKYGRQLYVTNQGDRFFKCAEVSEIDSVLRRGDWFCASGEEKDDG